MSGASVFQHWTEDQLKEYLRENGQPAPMERWQLIQEAERVSREVEAKVLGQAPGASYPPTQPDAGAGKYPTVSHSGAAGGAGTMSRSPMDNPYSAASAPAYQPAAFPGSSSPYPPTGGSAPPYLPVGGATPPYPPVGGAGAPYPPVGAAASPYPPVGGAAPSAAYPPTGGAPAYPGYPATGTGSSSPYPSVPGSADGRSSAYPQNPYGAPAAAPGPYGGGSSYPAGPPVAAGAGSYGGIPPSVPPASGKKKALLCGCNYFGTAAQLNGCINDAKCMEYLLKTKFGYQPENILLMVDNHTDPLRRPTRYNMLQGFTWLMSGLRPGDSLFFHFSGHGSQERDYTGEESDGMNETLCPCDFKSAGMIVDDEINRRLVNPLPTGVKLHAVVDACHSGSAFDLPYHASITRSGVPQWQSEYYGQTRTHKGTAGGFVVQFGAAKDSQVAADTQQLSGTGVATGAATYSFIQAIEQRKGEISYGQLLMMMHNTLMASGHGPSSSGGGGGGMMGMMMGALLGVNMSAFRGQEPVLSSVYAFDLNYKFDM